MTAVPVHWRHAPKPDPLLAVVPAASFVGRLVKKRFGDEHMWVEVHYVDDDVLKGRLANEPTDPNQTLRYLDPVDVRREEIEAVSPPFEIGGLA